MSQNSDPNSLIDRIKNRIILVFDDKKRRNMLITSAVAVIVCYLCFLIMSLFSGSVNYKDYETGKVADNDFLADRDITYIDNKATAVRTEAEKHLVYAVFSLDDSLTESCQDNFTNFKNAFFSLSLETENPNDLVLKLKKAFPEMEDSGILENLVLAQDPELMFNNAGLIIKKVLATGVFAVPATGLEEFNKETFEMRSWTEGPIIYNQIFVKDIVTISTVKKYIDSKASEFNLSNGLSTQTTDLAIAFIKENVFFDAEQSNRRMKSAIAHVEPVIRKISKGQTIIRKGFIVTSDDMELLETIKTDGSKLDVLRAISAAIFMIIIAIAASAILKNSKNSKNFEQKTFIFTLILLSGYFLLTIALSSFLPVGLSENIEFLLPTALISILSAILIGEQFSFMLTILLSSCLLFVNNFSLIIPAQAIIAGISGIILVRKAERRIDLVRASFQLALLRFLCGFTLAAISGNGWGGSMHTALWSAINGFFCGVLTLAFLPVLEQTLNVSTVFRLQELSDLNSPALKRLLDVAPGTYSHSVTVAHLAESACREIGANALLARVGSYYHDIGKIERPEYFIENQSGYNKHDEIGPRLSATILRGHVTFGLEKAMQLNLPEDVKAIIAEHHGNSVIGYFYSVAQKEDPDVKVEDFRYPGPIPDTKEAAVVMLADVVEAASRTLKKPTVSKIEQFVKEMIDNKNQSGQLALSPLTFRDLEIIQKTFTRILSGHFHSRIEYPKTKENN